MKKLVILISTLFFLGCATPPFIEGGAKGFSNEKLGRVRPLLPEKTNERIEITEVDGKRTYNPLYLPGMPTEAFLLPGKHTLKITWSRAGILAADTCIDVDVAAGKTYLIHKQLQGYGVSLWLVDKSTGAVVGNICGFKPLS
jgi:hypothetical protein